MPREAEVRVPFTYFTPYVGVGRHNQQKDREARKMTNRELARRVGIADRTISRYKAVGVTPLMFDRLCREIGKHPIELLGRALYQEFFGHAGPNPEGISILNDPVLGEFAREVGFVDKAGEDVLHRPRLDVEGTEGRAKGHPRDGEGGEGHRGAVSGGGVRGVQGVDEGVEATQGDVSAQQFYARARRRDKFGHFIPGFRGPVQYIPRPYGGVDEADDPEVPRQTAAG